MKKLKRAVIKEELVELTGSYTDAIILNQMIYWSERVKDFDKFILEEKQRALTEGINNGIELTNGWIYKKAEEIAEETMLNLVRTTIGKIFNNLIEKGWLNQRKNPLYKWDKTYQYRVNLMKIQEDLNKLGYELEGYKINLEHRSPNNGHRSPFEEVEDGHRSPNNELHSPNIGHHSPENELHSPENGLRCEEKWTAIPEITTNIITETKIENTAYCIKEKSTKKEIEIDNTPYHEIFNLYNSICTSLKQSVDITTKRKKMIKDRYIQHGEDIEFFRTIFTLVEESDFLTNRDKQRDEPFCDLMWIMDEEHMVNIREGRYANRNKIPMVPSKKPSTMAAWYDPNTKLAE